MKFKMIEHCGNPWKKGCKDTEIVLYIKNKEKIIPLCKKCWINVSKSSKSW